MLLFWIGIPVTVVLSIAANLLTPRVQTALAQRTASQRVKRIAKLRQQVADMQRCSRDPSAALAYVGLRIVISFGNWAMVTLYGSVIGAYSAQYEILKRLGHHASRTSFDVLGARSLVGRLSKTTTP